MIHFKDYPTQFPNLPIEALIFFSIKETKDDKHINKKVIEFCSHYKQKYSTKEIPQPRFVAKVCDILVENNFLALIAKAGVENIQSSYYANLNEEIFSNPILLKMLSSKLDYIVYGFKYIYDDYKHSVLPIKNIDKYGDQSLGTCFLFYNGVVTAKHCLENAQKISIKGITKEMLNNATFEIHSNELMDLLFIRFNDNNNFKSIVLHNNAEILDEVLTFGYPRLPGYHNFLTVENATVSSRFTASVGQVVSNAEDIWIKEKLLLITAKIKEGNSGGPVVNRNGEVIGISANLLMSKGNYDDLGYGTVIPIHFLIEIMEKQNEKCFLNINSIEFIDFEE